MSSIATKINNANAGVTASVLFDGSAYRLMVASKAPGTANAATFTETGSGLGLSNSANIKVSAKDASLTIDGVTITRSTNVITDALAGATITAVSAHTGTEPDSQVVVSNDVSSLTAKLKSFVTSFNSVSGAVASQLTYNANSKNQSVLFGDSTLRGLQNSLSTFTSQPFGSTNMTALGLSMDKDGLISLDSDKLAKALGANPGAMTDLSVGSTKCSASAHCR